MTKGRVAILAGFLYLAVVYGLTIIPHLRHGPTVDEVEYLHTAYRMAHGERIYVDFAEHHSPLFFAMLMPLAPDGHTTDEMLGYVKRARLMTGAFAAIAVAICAYVMYRVTGRASIALLFTGVCFAARTVWLYGIGDIRADSPGLALWWGGAALVLLAKRAWLRGLGLGLVFCAALVNPKWPFTSIVIGIVFLIGLWRERRGALASIGVALLVSAAGIAAIAAIAPLDVVYVHVFEITRAMTAHVYELREDFALYTFWKDGPPLLHPLIVLAAAVPVLFAWRKTRNPFVPVLLALLVASLLEIRFFYLWPVIHTRYYVFWTFAGAMLLTLVPNAIEQKLSLRFLTPAAIVLALLAAPNMRPLPAPDPDIYWVSARWMEKQLGPNDTVWLEVVRHPIGVRDASYYWFSFSLHASLELARTPRGARYLPPIQAADLPVCRLERGLEPNLRFFSAPRVWAQPEVTACFERLRARGAIEFTGVPDVWRPRR